MTTGRINQIATVRGLPKPRECENPKETPLVFVKLSDPPRDEALRFALGYDQMWVCKTELKLRLPGRRSPSASKRPHPQESWLGGSLAHPLGRRIARGSRTVTLRRTESQRLSKSRRSEVRPLESRPMMRAPEAAVASRRGNSPPGWRANGASVSHCAHCVPPC